MTPAEQTAWSQVNVLAEMDALLSAVVHTVRMRGPQSALQTALEGLCGYSAVVASLQAQLIEAESGRPRIYYLSRP